MLLYYLKTVLIGAGVRASFDEFVVFLQMDLPYILIILCRIFIRFSYFELRK